MKARLVTSPENTKTQRHKGTKECRNPKNINAAFLCAFVSLCFLPKSVYWYQFELYRPLEMHACAYTSVVGRGDWLPRSQARRPFYRCDAWSRRTHLGDSRANRAGRTGACNR